MWGNSSHHVGKQHPMSIIEGSKVHPFSTETLPTIWWNSQSDLLQQSSSSVRVNINKVKKTVTAFNNWRHKTFAEKELQNQDARKGETLKPKKRSKTQKMRSYLLGTMPAWSRQVKEYPVLDFIDYSLRGSGQVIFCDNSITGLFILAAVYLGNVWTGVCATIGLVVATATALLLNFNMGAIRAGLFGYNGVLVGAALGTFLANGTWSGSTVAAIVIMCMFSTVIAAALGAIASTWRLPTFTLSFNFSTIIFMLGVYHYYHYSLLPDIQGSFSPPHGVVTSDAIWRAELPLAVLRGISQVWLISNEYSGVMIVVGVAICSPISALFALIGSTIGLTVAVALGVNAQEVFAGLWGYNAVLGCVAIGGVLYILKIKVVVLTVMCGIFCTVLLGTFKGLFATLGMPAFTFPFCLSTLAFLLLQTAMSDVIPMPLASITTPELNLATPSITENSQENYK